MAKALCATATALLLVACGPTSRQDVSPPVPPTEALAAWKDFPAAANPRPVVWLFTSFHDVVVNASSKMAAYCHRLALAEGLQLPAAPPETATATWPTGVRSPYAPLSAAEAFAAMTRPPADANRSQCTSAAALTVTAARFGTYGFGTDRGTAEISAWLFTVGELGGEVAYPALAPAAFWSGGVARNSGRVATVSADDRTLTLTFWGAPAGPVACRADYSAAVAESGSAVAIAVKQIRPAIACSRYGEIRTLTIHLASALGGRVVVEDRGGVVAVCPDGPPSQLGGVTSRC